MDTAAIVEEAESALRDVAREHTKLSFAHRKTAERLHRKADDLRKKLAALGISVRIVGTDEKESQP